MEIWELRNPSGGWHHPAHIHFIDFRVLSRNGAPPLPHELGAKDVVFLGENETVRLLIKFDRGRGKYMIHCHNLVHEDHDMMGQFVIRDDAVPADDPLSTGPSGCPTETSDDRRGGGADPGPRAARSRPTGRCARSRSGSVLVAAVAHVWVVPEHLAEWLPAAVFFVVVSAGQVALAWRLRRSRVRPRPGSRAAGDIGVVVFYVMTRTVDLPFLPAAHAGSTCRRRGASATGSRSSPVTAWRRSACRTWCVSPPSSSRSAPSARSPQPAYAVRRRAGCSRSGWRCSRCVWVAAFSGDADDGAHDAAAPRLGSSRRCWSSSPWCALRW